MDYYISKASVFFAENVPTGHLPSPELITRTSIEFNSSKFFSDDNIDEGLRAIGQAAYDATAASGIFDDYDRVDIKVRAFGSIEKKFSVT